MIPNMESTILNNITDSVVITDLEGVVIYWNQAASDIFGIPKDQILGKKINLMDASYDPKATLQAFEQNGYQPIRADWAYEKANGEVVWIDAKITPFRSPEGEMLGVIGISKDITQRKTIEQTLQKSKNWLSRALELGQTGSWEWNLHTKQPNWSKKMLEIYGYNSIADIPAFEDWADTIYPEDKERVMAQIDKALNENEKYNIIFRSWKGTEKSIRYLHAIGEVVLDELTQTPHLLGVARDVSDWKDTEIQLLESLNFNKNIILNALEGIAVLDERFNCLIWNPVLETILGIKAQQTRGHNFFDVLGLEQEKRKAYERVFGKVLRGRSQVFEDRIKLQSGENPKWHWLKIVLSPNRIKSDQSPGIIAIINEISEKKQKELTLQETSEQLRLATETGRIGYWKHDITTNISQWNDELFRMLGLKRDEYEANPETWRKIIHPDDRYKAFKNLERLFDGEEVRNIAFRIVRPDGEIRHISASGKGICDSKGNVIQGIGVNIDVTHLKKHEASLLQKNTELEKINKALDTFVYHTSHNLRAPLANIQGLLEILETKLTEQERNKFLDYARQNVNNLDKTIQSIIDYSYNTRVRKTATPVYVRELVESVIRSLSFMNHSPKVRIQNDIEEAICLISDSERLRMVFLNLISNALKYHDPQKPQPYIQINSKESGTCYQFEIKDNGIGIPKEQEEKIFEMFVRATDRGRGSGLGLYIVREVVDLLEGKLFFTSSLGKGSSFFVEFGRLPHS